MLAISGVYQAIHGVLKKLVCLVGDYNIVAIIININDYCFPAAVHHTVLNHFPDVKTEMQMICASWDVRSETSSACRGARTRAAMESNSSRNAGADLCGFIRCPRGAGDTLKVSSLSPSIAPPSAPQSLQLTCLHQCHLGD